MSLIYDHLLQRQSLHFHLLWQRSSHMSWYDTSWYGRMVSFQSVWTHFWQNFSAKKIEHGPAGTIYIPLVGSSDYVFWQGHSVPKPALDVWLADLGNFLAQGSKKICYIVKLLKNTKNIRIINNTTFAFFFLGYQIKQLFWW